MYLRFFSVIVTNIRSFFFSIEILSLNGEKVCQKKFFFDIVSIYGFIRPPFCHRCEETLVTLVCCVYLVALLMVVYVYKLPVA